MNYEIVKETDKQPVKPAGEYPIGTISRSVEGDYVGELLLTTYGMHSNQVVSLTNPEHTWAEAGYTPKAVPLRRGETVTLRIT